MTDVKLFEFDGTDENLDLVPLAARRMLDRLGSKLSLEGWRSLSLDDRRTLLASGAKALVDEASARSVLLRAIPLPQTIDPVGDPDENEVSVRVSARLTPERPLSTERWKSLTPLERWALEKCAKSKNVGKFAQAYDEILWSSRDLPHLNASGEAHMVATTTKAPTVRHAVASSRVSMSEAAHRALKAGNAAKGDVLGTARVAAIMAAKQTSQLIPLCHPIHLTQIEIALTLSVSEPTVEIHAEVVAVDRTGVEMEAMVAVSVAALTIYDMLKSVDRSMVIGPTQLLSKSGGKSGEFQR